jgi:hypothetical protein
VLALVHELVISRPRRPRLSDSPYQCAGPDHPRTRRP